MERYERERKEKKYQGRNRMSKKYYEREKRMVGERKRERKE